MEDKPHFLIVDRGDTHYSTDHVEQLNQYVMQLAVHRQRANEKCSCCERRVCWKHIHTMEMARQFLLSHVPHKDEKHSVKLAWTLLASHVCSKAKSQWTLNGHVQSKTTTSKD